MLKCWPILHMNVSYTTISDFSFFFLSHSLAFNELFKCRNEFPTPTLKHTHSSFSLQTFVSILELRTKCKFIFNRSSCTFFVFFFEKHTSSDKTNERSVEKKEKKIICSESSLFDISYTRFFLCLYFFFCSVIDMKQQQKQITVTFYL